MRTAGKSPALRVEADEVDLALTDLRPGRLAGAAFGGCSRPTPSAGPAAGFGPSGNGKATARDSGNVKISLSDTVQITFATVVHPGDPAEG